jgi:hypothetical protein
MTGRKRTPAPQPRPPSALVDRAADDAPHARHTPRRDPLKRAPRAWLAEPDACPDAGRGRWHRAVRD